MIDNRIIYRFTNTCENWNEIIERICSISTNGNSIKKYILDGYFVPGGQILRGAGFSNSVLYNSFVTSIDIDESEFDIANRIMKWTELGIGVGVNVSDWIKNQTNFQNNSLKNIAEAICKSQQILWEKGITRTATMINIDFDIEGISELAINISKKESLRHINLGILLTDDLMRKALIYNSEEYKKLNELSYSIWQSGNPGLIFIDHVNRHHPFKNEIINACNSCAEQFLLPNEGCCLGSINLSKFTINKKFNFEQMQDCIKESIFFLDNCIDASSFPCIESEKYAKNRRRIGLGIMGLGTMLEDLNIEYSSDEAINLCAKIAMEIKKYSEIASVEIAKSKGSFPDFAQSTLINPRRNSYLNSIAPTGAISLLFQNSSGIEPVFSSEFLKGAIKVKLRNNDANKNTIFDISIEDQINMLSIWQSNIDGGISKTLNVEERTNPSQIYTAIVLAWKKECKGISIYRHNSRQNALNIL